MFLLFVSRHILNAAWRKHLLREGYTPLRIFETAVNIVPAIIVLSLPISGMIPNKNESLNRWESNSITQNSFFGWGTIRLPKGQSKGTAYRFGIPSPYLYCSERSCSYSCCCPYVWISFAGGTIFAATTCLL